LKTSRISAKASLFCILFFLASSYVSNSVKASPGTVVKVEPQTTSAQVGETLNVSINIVDVQNLYGIALFLHWDPSILEATNTYVRLGVEDYPDGVLHKQILPLADKINQTSGTYSVAALSISPAGSFNGSGTVAIITFSVIKKGSCELELDPQSTLASRLATRIDYTIVNASLSSQSAPSPPSEGVDWNSLIVPVAVVIVMIIAGISIVYARRIRERQTHSTKQLKQKESGSS